ncbi:von Willebrand factor type A domain-containing protein, partial [Planctomycetota bacterium]
PAPAPTPARREGKLRLREKLAVKETPPAEEPEILLAQGGDSTVEGTPVVGGLWGDTDENGDGDEVAPRVTVFAGKLAQVEKNKANEPADLIARFYREDAEVNQTGVAPVEAPLAEITGALAAARTAHAGEPAPRELLDALEAAHMDHDIALLEAEEKRVTEKENLSRRAEEFQRRVQNQREVLEERQKVIAEAITRTKAATVESLRKLSSAQTIYRVDERTADEKTGSEQQLLAELRRQGVELHGSAAELASKGKYQAALEELERQGLPVATLCGNVEHVPPVDGQVAAFDASESGSTILLTVNDRKNLQKGLPFTIYRDNTFVGKAVLVHADDHFAHLRLLFTAPGKTLRAGDLASTRLEPGDAPGAQTAANIPATPARLATMENKLRAFSYYRDLYPGLTIKAFLARRLTIPEAAVGDEGLGRERFRERYGVNPFIDTNRDHLSTFAMDVDTASYARTRRLLRSGELPKPETVRVEEFVNSFRQDYPSDAASVFSVFCEGGPSPFGRELELLKVTVKARELFPGERKKTVLTFAIDTSGSMFLEGRLRLVKQALSKLLASLGGDDRVAIVAYGSQAYLALPHTPARERERILGALASLSPQGSTNVEAGLDLAYRLADEAQQPKALNRVVLCSDGVATEGARGAEEILKKVKVYARRGIDLSVVGFGLSRYNDGFLERLANEGNGNYAYVDSLAEAERLFKENLPSLLEVLARDAKIQVDFNPVTVSHYRLLGYENRDIRDADFRNDAVDAGEVGPGTTVTALYEVRRNPGAHGPLGRVFLRFFSTTVGRVEELDFPLSPGVVHTSLQETSERFRLIACAAELAELLRNSYWARNGSYSGIVRVLAGMSPEGRSEAEWQELYELTHRAQALAISKLAQ